MVVSIVGEGGDRLLLVLSLPAGNVVDTINLSGAEDRDPKFLGDAVLFSSNPYGDYALFLYDGDTSLLYDSPGYQGRPSVSPSGRYVAFVSGDTSGNLAVYDLTERYAQTWYSPFSVSWVLMPDDTHALTLGDGVLRLFSLDSLTWEEVAILGNAYAPALSPDGSTLAYVEVGDSFRITLLGGRVLGAYSDSVRGVVWSPDGRYLAFGLGDGLYLTDTSGNLYLIRDSLRGVWVGDWAE